MSSPELPASSTLSDRASPLPIAMAVQDVGWAATAIVKSLQSAIDILNGPWKQRTSGWRWTQNPSKQYILAAQALSYTADLISRSYESGMESFGSRFTLGDRTYRPNLVTLSDLASLV
jgi:hypothetical protein